MAFPPIYTMQTIYPALITLANQLHFEHENSAASFSYTPVFNQLLKDLYPGFSGEVTDMAFDKIGSFYQLWDPVDHKRFIDNFRTFATAKRYNFRYEIEHNGNDPGSVDRIFDEKATLLKLISSFFIAVISFRSAFDSICRINKDLRDFAAAYPAATEMTPVNDDPRIFPPVLNGWMTGLVLAFMGNVEEEFIQASETAKDKIKSLSDHTLSRKDIILKELYLFERKIVQQQLNNIVMEGAKINFNWAINKKEGVVKKQVDSRDAYSLIKTDIENKQYWSVYSNNVELVLEDIDTYYNAFINGCTGPINLAPVIWYSPATPYDSKG